MNNKQFGVMVFSIAFGITCLIWSVLMGVMAKDLVEQINELEQEKIGLEWQLEQVDQMICIKE